VRRPPLRGAFWPSPVQHELLRVVLGPVEEAGGRWRALQPVDVRSLETGSFPLLPLLHERLAEVEPDDPRLPLLKGTYRSVWYRNRLLFERLGALVAALRELRVDAVLVGGAAAVRRYEGLGSRYVPQLELLVAPAAAPAAETAARGVGWRRDGGGDGLRRLVSEDGRVLVVHEGVPAPVAGPLGPAAAYAALRAGAHEHEVEGTRAPVLDAADEALLVCGLGARTTPWPNVQWLIDLARLLGAADAPDPVRLAARARALHLVEPLRDTAAYLLELGAAGAAALVAAVSDEPVSRRDDLAYRLDGIARQPLGDVGTTLARQLRADADAPLPAAAARVSRVALGKAVRLARTRVGASAQPSVAVRNRSVSS
jgi:hypothetical protein